MKGFSSMIAMAMLSGGIMGGGLDGSEYKDVNCPPKYGGKRVGLSEEELEHVRSLSKKERKAYMKKKREEYAKQSKKH